LDVNEIIRKTHQICSPPKDELENMQKTLITLALKNTLLELGHDELDKVTTILQKDHSMTLDDVMIILITLNKFYKICLVNHMVIYYTPLKKI